MASRKKLPNLKISVDNTQSSDDSDAGVAISDASSFDGDDSVEDSKARAGVRLEDGEVNEEDVLSIGAAEPTERRFLSRSALRQTQAETYGPKIYENKAGNFVTGVDITSEEATEKREKRAQRFGTLSTPKQPITDVDIKNLYKSLGMSTDTLDQDVRGWRTDAIMLRGTENMSTKDVFDYYSEYAPKGVEWIDDFTCNVLWQDKLTPARALLKLSSSMEEVGVTEKPLEVEGPSFDGVSPLNRDKEKENPESGTDASKNVAGEAASDSGGAAVTNVLERSKAQPAPAAVVRAHSDAVLNVLEEEAMELDYDDNLDLTEEDPIDKALSTWANFSQNKKFKAEQAKETERKKSEKHKEKERASQKEREYQDAEIKEEKDFNEKCGSRTNKAGQKSRSVPEFEVQNQAGPVSSRQHKKSSSKLDKSKDKLKVAEVSKSSKKRNDKMDTSDESDSESSSYGSSSSGTGSASSTGSSSSSGSGSESGSRSSASSVDTIKAKQRKSRERRDKDNEVRKNSRRAAPPPILPQVKEKADIPWPPGWWRLGVPYPKAKYLFMRYAMKADKKLPGAEKRSQYYVKHGNPNFGGIVGFISKSRKRRLRNVGQEEPVEDSVSQDLVKSEDNPEGAQSRLAGRVGTRGAFGGNKRRDTEDEDDKPRLKAGGDLRDLLNRDVAAVQPDTDKTEAKDDSDDEMDYGAELERLMGDDAPPTKKRFMRMHADDEEEKIQAKRLLNVRKDTSKWPRGDYGHEEEEVEEEEDFEVEEALRPRRKEWVDYDNVEDDDPFNLFGTSSRAPPKNVVDKDDEEEEEVGEEDDDDNADYGRAFRREGGSDDRAGRDVRQRLGGSDLRAKIQERKRVNTRTW